MIVVYIAGPLTTGAVSPAGFNAHVFEQNVRVAEAAMLQVYDAGWSPICVHAQARYIFGRVAEPVAIAADLELIRRADAVWLVGRWQASTGSKNERDFACELGKPVFTEFRELVEWAREIEAVR